MDDDRTVGPPDHLTSGEHVLDETDPHAGDDTEWEQVEPATPADEPSPLVFWRGLVVGLLLSGAGWLVLALAVFAISRLAR